MQRVSTTVGYWVETGYLQLGSGLNLGGLTTAGRYGFWADQRPGSSFFAHVLQNNPSLNNGATAEIWQTSDTTFDADFNGHIATSTGNSMEPQYGEWGSETTSDASHSLGRGVNIEYRTGSTWHNGVPSPFDITYAPQTFRWTVNYTSYQAGVPC